MTFLKWSPPSPKLRNLNSIIISILHNDNCCYLTDLDNELITLLFPHVVPSLDVHVFLRLLLDSGPSDTFSEALSLRFGTPRGRSGPGSRCRHFSASEWPIGTVVGDRLCIMCHMDSTHPTALRHSHMVQLPLWQGNKLTGNNKYTINVRRK